MTRRRIILTMTILFALLLAAPVQASATPSAPVFHVTSVRDHIRAKDEQSFSKALHTRVFTGVIGDRVFTIEEAVVFATGSHFKVGEDYEVEKLEDSIGRTIKIREHPDKKGKTFTEWLIVTAVEEKK